MWFMNPHSHAASLEFNKHMHILKVQCECNLYKPGNIAGLGDSKSTPSTYYSSTSI